MQTEGEINYCKKIEDLLKIEGIWRSEFKEIYEDAIGEVIEILRPIDKLELQRMLWILEDRKEPELDIFNACIGGTGIVLAIAALTISAHSNKNIVAFINLLFLALVIAAAAYTGLFLMPRSISRNKKIKCIEIAIKELL